MDLTDEVVVEKTVKIICQRQVVSESSEEKQHLDLIVIAEVRCQCQESRTELSDSLF